VKLTRNQFVWTRDDEPEPFETEITEEGDPPGEADEE